MSLIQRIKEMLGFAAQPTRTPIDRGKEDFKMRVLMRTIIKVKLNNTPYDAQNRQRENQAPTNGLWMRLGGVVKRC